MKRPKRRQCYPRHSYWGDVLLARFQPPGCFATRQPLLSLRCVPAWSQTRRDATGLPSQSRCVIHLTHSHGYAHTPEL